MIRQMDEYDANWVSRLLDDKIFTFTDGKSTPTPEHIRKMILSPSVVGYCDMRQRGAIIAEHVHAGGMIVWFLAVDPSSQNHGVGKALLGKVTSSSDWQVLYTHKGTSAVEFYKKQGFETNDKPMIEMFNGGMMIEDIK